MSGQFYVVYIKPDAEVTDENLKVAMNKALDWYMVSRDFWVVYTNKDADALYTRFKPFVSSKGRVLVGKLDTSDRQGWMAKGFWEWLKKERTN